eukprot:TRINITY_DN1998_c1_g1_i1.p1 TRINITY_DN1998_c1_g1~~TRINITY_DN1998_c1_g1_i1.p1  ORF type:complete len:481 (+),score=124.61 TRINITY_DN1998_c1_g1_i1:67-1509(+)
MALAFTAGVPSTAVQQPTLHLRASRDIAAVSSRVSADALSSSEASSSWMKVAAGIGGAAVVVQCAKKSNVRKAEKRVVAMKAEKRFPILSTRLKAEGGAFPKLPASVSPGVVTGPALQDLLNWAKQNNFAIPAVNCVSSSSINACLEAARKVDAPIIIQLSSGGAQFYAGKGLDNSNFHAAIAGAVAAAYHTRALSEQYGVPVILHTDHCAKKLLPWLDGLMEANERYFALHGEPLFSSHMIDLSEEPLEENIAICKQYLERMAKINVGLEMELGITGGEEDGVNNEDVAQEDLYSKPEEIWQVYKELATVENANVTIAAAFGNCHGVYQVGNVKLKPTILDAAQKYISEKIGDESGKPVNFVFHGGSGSDLADIREAIDYGVIKMNIDTDTQWAYWNGIREFEGKYRPYLQSQIGNPDGETKPNKKYYDPRACLRSAEEHTVTRLQQAFEDLRCTERCGLGPAGQPENVLGPRRGALPA